MNKTSSAKLMLLVKLALTALLPVFQPVHAQSPGGVKSPEVWFKTIPVTSNLQGYYKWKDFGGDSVRLNSYDALGTGAGTEYTFNRRVQTFNFNPALNISELDGSVYQQVLLGKTNLSQGTIISVCGGSADFDKDLYMYALNGRPGEGIIMTKDKVLQSKESGRSLFDYGEADGDDLRFSPNDREKTLNKFRERTLRVQTYYRLNKPDYNLWGERPKAVISLGSSFDPNNINNSSTFNLSDLNNHRFIGFTPEMIVYNRMLTPLERLKIESYLAIKYGFTLNVSYISSGDKLIWDLEANKGYNNRITGISRDDASALNQPISTTSYEEAPCYSDDYYKDSYDNSNSYHRSSRYRLLVIGRPYGVNMKDGEYTIWGDDEKSFNVESRVIGELKTMSRNWKVRTNIGLPASTDMEVWNYSGMQMVAGTNNRGSFIKETTDSYAGPGIAVSKQPLSGANGYFSWIANSNRGPMIIKFGTQNPNLTAGSNDYGYYITNSGQVFSIVAGVRQTTQLLTINIGELVEIEKTEDKITLRVNGDMVLNKDIIINTGDRNKTYYGTLLLEKGDKDFILENFSANGFYYGTKDFYSRGDHRIELSYITERAFDFANYNEGLAYLIIDRSGTGAYPPGQTEYYVSDEVDKPRYKIIFNNIFWDTDGNGSDVFTFGYIEPGKLAIAVKTTDPTCFNRAPNKDGIIRIGVESGLRGFNYTVTNTADTTIKRTGRFFEDSLKVESLPAGTYTINISEIGGQNFQVGGTGTFRPSAVTTAMGASTGCVIDWLAGGKSGDGKTQKDSGAVVGFMVSSSGVKAPLTGFTTLPNYGILKFGNELYAIVKGIQETTSFALVQAGDKITIERTATDILYKINGVEIARRPIAAGDQKLRYYGAVILSAASAQGANELGNLNLTGFSSNLWQLSGNIMVKQSAQAKIITTAILENKCMLPPPQTLGTVMDNHLITYYKNMGDLKTFTAKVTLSQPGNSQLLIFNMSGVLVYQTMLSNNEKVQEKDITLQVAGMYVVKAITPEGEYSKQVIIQ